MFTALTDFITKPLFKWGLIALAIAALVGYHFWTVRSLNADLTAQKLETQQRVTELTQARADLQTLQTAYNAMAQQVEQARTNIDNITEELNQVRMQDRAARDQLRRVEQKLADARYQARERALREGPRAELLLQTYNRDLACMVANFGRKGGECVAGQWVSR